MPVRESRRPGTDGRSSTQSVDAALKADVEIQLSGLGQVPLKYRQRNIMAGADAEQLMALVASIDQYASEVGTQGFNVRLHAGASATLSP